MKSSDRSIPMNRRKFIASAGAASVAFSIIPAQSVRGTQANSKITLGLIGCGNRGAWIANLFQEHGGYEISALADYFPDRVAACGDQFQVGARRRFTGLSCYKRLLDAKVDAIAIESPPYFHPEQAAAGVEAGVHVYLAKPIAVDVPGCQSIAKSGALATEKNLCFLVDFQTRANDLYREAIKRVQYGEIGKIFCGEASYHCGPTWTKFFEIYDKGKMTAEDRLRGWGLDRALSGDVITEQNIHALDVATWILDSEPISAVGTGGQERKQGNCWDHFSVIYTFPDDVLVTFNSKQYGKGYDDILCRMYGTTGTIDTHYFGTVAIRGDMPFKGGETGNIYQDAVRSNITEFHESICSQQYANTTVTPSVRSNLTTILGRMAAYRQDRVTWQEMLVSQERFLPDLQGLTV